MKQRKAFSLLELTVATVISSFVLVSMASIYTAANKHVLQSYRSDAIKNGVSLSMRAIRNVMAQATRIDLPVDDGTNTRLAVATNVDPSGCYPIANPSTINGAPTPEWHLFCVDTTNVNNYKLYYHHGLLKGSCACPANCVIPNYAATVCGSNGGMLLAQYLSLIDPVFSSRHGSVAGGTGVRVTLHSIWNTGGAVNRTQHPVDYELDGVFNAAMRAR